LKKERVFFFGVPSYRSCPLIGSFISLRSQKPSMSLEEASSIRFLTLLSISEREGAGLKMLEFLSTLFYSRILFSDIMKTL